MAAGWARNAIVGQPASTLAALVRAGQIAVHEVIEAHLAHIAAVDPSVGAFRCVRTEKALTEARDLQARADLDTLPLAGVPVAIKDNVPVAGEAMRIGCLATPDAPSQTDHETVRRLRQGGAIVVGTTRVPELCVWGTTDDAFGVTRNPWNLQRTAGGSSGGSAAAVASAMVPLALGADGMGSIRIPAAACGLVGIKPGTGVVPSNLGVSSWYGMAENGPLATTTVDAALMLAVLADRADLRQPAPPDRTVRIAITTRSPLAGIRVDPEFAGAVVEAGRRLSDAGHTVEWADPPRARIGEALAVIGTWAAAVAQDAEGLDFQKLEPRTRGHVRVGRMARRLGLVGKHREAWRHVHESFFRRFDLLLTPMLASAPIRADAWSRRGWATNFYTNVCFAPFAAACNYAGYPAAAVPAGMHSNGMPLSVQLVAPHAGEPLILSVVKQLEMLQPWPRHAPNLPGHAG